MMYQDHLRTCGYCRNDLKAKKLAELGHMIRGTSYAGPERSKGASSTINDIPKPEKKSTLRLRPILSEKQKKLRELGKIIKGYVG